MGKEEILSKADLAIRKAATSDAGFEERDVVYLLVELYKLKEREIKEQELRTKFAILSFFRDWVVHTNLHSKEWVERRAELADPDGLITQMIEVLENDESKSLLDSNRESFIGSLKQIVSNQDITLRG